MMKNDMWWKWENIAAKAENTSRSMAKDHNHCYGVRLIGKELFIMHSQPPFAHEAGNRKNRREGKTCCSTDIISDCLSLQQGIVVFDERSKSCFRFFYNEWNKRKIWNEKRKNENRPFLALPLKAVFKKALKKDAKFILYLYSDDTTYPDIPAEKAENC